MGLWGLLFLIAKKYENLSDMVQAAHFADEAMLSLSLRKVLLVHLAARF